MQIQPRTAFELYLWGKSFSHDLDEVTIACLQLPIPFSGPSDATQSKENHCDGEEKKQLFTSLF